MRNLTIVPLCAAALGASASGGWYAGQLRSETAVEVERLANARSFYGKPQAPSEARGETHTQIAAAADWPPLNLCRVETADAFEFHFTFSEGEDDGPNGRHRGRIVHSQKGIKDWASMSGPFAWEVLLTLERPVVWENMDKTVRVMSDGPLPPWEPKHDWDYKHENQTLLINFFGRMWGQTIHVCLSDWP